MPSGSPRLTAAVLFTALLAVQCVMLCGGIFPEYRSASVPPCHQHQAPPAQRVHAPCCQDSAMAGSRELVLAPLVIARFEAPMFETPTLAPEPFDLRPPALPPDLTALRI